MFSSHSHAFRTHLHTVLNKFEVTVDAGFGPPKASTGTPAASTISRSSGEPVKRVLMTSAPSSTAARADAAMMAGLLESSLVTG